MAKIYTAKEMRQTANAEELVGRPNVAEMLRQAAEFMEREIEKRDALIKELADALNHYLIGECVDCGQFCKSDNMCDHAAKYRELIAKARGIVK